MITDLITLDRPLIAIDVETTGLHHIQDRICSLGLVKAYPDGKVTEWSSLVNPTIDISEEVSLIHHITNAMVEEEPTFKDLSTVLYTGLKECDLLGYNVYGFDLKFLRSEFQRCSINFPIPRVIDSYKLFTRLHPRNLKSAVSHYLQEDLEDAHSALADARAAFRVFRAQLLAHPELPRDIQELHDAFFSKNKDSLDPDSKIIWIGVDACINFGKYKGKPLAQVPKQYRQWIASGAETSDEVRLIMKESIAGRYPVKEVK
jgi:DNA polymerase-3 subunit epsilon